MIYRSNINTQDVPPGALISFIQKGIQYLEIEASLADEDGGEVLYKRPYELLAPAILQRNKKEHLAQLAAQQQQLQTQQPAQALLSQSSSQVSVQQNGLKQQERKPTAITMDLDESPSTAPENGPPIFPQPQPIDQVGSAPVTPAAGVAGPSSATPSSSSTSFGATSSVPPTFADHEIVVLRGHQAEVPLVRWNPVLPMIASGSGDCTARLWSLTASPESSVSLSHDTKDVTSLDFSPDGQHLLTGAMDGILRVWRSSDGQLVQQAPAHRGCVFNAKWNRGGSLIASVSKDKSALVWNPSTNQVVQQYVHSFPVLDIDWRDNTMFATACVDRLVRVFDLEGGQPGQPIRVFEGHQNDVNSVRFSPSGELLASCSDDRTVKVWNVGNPAAANLVHNLQGHNDAVFVIRWSPRQPNLLLSGSNDGCIRIWDITSGFCVGSLKEHKDGISAASFSPDGAFFASASADGRILVWSVRDQKVVKSFSGESTAFDVSFSPQGDRIVASFGDSRIVVLEWRS